jgi:hypothetical protein
MGTRVKAYGGPDELDKSDAVLKIPLNPPCLKGFFEE